MPPLVSVGIPYYNVEKFVEKCARSLFSQTLDSMEFVFVDDASTDHSTEIIQKVLAEFPHRKSQVKFLSHTQNRGPMRGRLDAFQCFTGRYFIFCDADDLVEPDMYDAMLGKAEERGADVVHCGFSCQCSSGKVEKDCELFDLSDISTYRKRIASLQTSPFLVVHLFRRDAVDVKNFYLPENIRNAEDLLFLSQLLRQCRSVACCTKKGYYYYIRHSGSLSHSNEKRRDRGIGLVLYFLDRSEKDKAILDARKTAWRNWLYAAIRSHSLTPRRRKVFLRYCGAGALSDQNLKRKKRLKLWLYWGLSWLC